MSLSEFMREFPDNATCLAFVWRQRYSADGDHAHCPKCDRERVFKKYAMSNRKTSWCCTGCSHHLHPLVGTIYEKSSTSLHLWFYAQYLMSSTRGGISAKQLERELGVTYKTAWRMMNLIRNQLMVQDDTRLDGSVEADETFIGGRIKANVVMSMARQMARKSIVFAAVEREGAIRATVIPNSGAGTMTGAVRSFIMPTATLYTDELPGYIGVGREYRAHHRIHHKSKIYVQGHVHTNTIEGFFGNMKPGITGVYRSVSKKWLQGYLNEYVFRYNLRKSPVDPFWHLMERAVA